MARLQKPANRSSPHSTTPAFSFITIQGTSDIRPIHAHAYTEPQPHTCEGAAQGPHSQHVQHRPPHRHEPFQSGHESCSRVAAVALAVYHCGVASDELRRHKSNATSESESSTHVYCRLSSDVHSPQRRQLGCGRFYAVIFVFRGHAVARCEHVLSAVACIASWCNATAAATCEPLTEVVAAVSCTCVLFSF